MCVAGADEHRAVHYCENVYFVIDMLIDDAKGTASGLPKTLKIRRERPEAFFGNSVARIVILRVSPFLRASSRFR